MTKMLTAYAVERGVYLRTSPAAYRRRLQDRLAHRIFAWVELFGQEVKVEASGCGGIDLGLGRSSLSPRFGDGGPD